MERAETKGKEKGEKRNLNGRREKNIPKKKLKERAVRKGVEEECRDIRDKIKKALEKVGEKKKG